MHLARCSPYLGSGPSAPLRAAGAKSQQGSKPQEGGANHPADQAVCCFAATTCAHVIVSGHGRNQKDRASALTLHIGRVWRQKKEVEGALRCRKPQGSCACIFSEGLMPLSSAATSRQSSKPPEADNHPDLLVQAALGVQTCPPKPASVSTAAPSMYRRTRRADIDLNNTILQGMRAHLSVIQGNNIKGDGLPRRLVGSPPGVEKGTSLDASVGRGW